MDAPSPDGWLVERNLGFVRRQTQLLALAGFGPPSPLHALRVVYSLPQLAPVVAVLYSAGRLEARVLDLKPERLDVSPELFAREAEACELRWLPASFYDPPETLRGVPAESVAAEAEGGMAAGAVSIERTACDAGEAELAAIRDHLAGAERFFSEPTRRRSELPAGPAVEIYAEYGVRFALCSDHSAGEDLYFRALGHILYEFASRRLRDAVRLARSLRSPLARARPDELHALLQHELPSAWALLLRFLPCEAVRRACALQGAEFLAEMEERALEVDDWSPERGMAFRNMESVLQRKLSIR